MNRLFVLVILFSLGMNTQPAQSESLVLKFSHVVTPDTPKGKAVEYFKKLVEERSSGQIKIEVYPSSTIYKDGDEIDALRVGVVHFLAPSLAKFSPLGVPEFELFDLPYIFPNKETLYRVMDGEIGQSLFKKLEANGFIGLAYWDNGFKQMSADKPLRKPEDFKGLRIRIQPSKVIDAQIRILGGIPKPMALNQVYTAFQQGTIDGTENTFSNFYTQKMYEVQKHLTLSDHGYLGYAVITNKKFWDELPSPSKKIIQEAMTEATKYERQISQKENDDALTAILAAKTTKVYVLPFEERQKWQQVLLPVHHQFQGVIGRETIYKVYAIAAQVESEQRNNKTK